MSRLVLLLPLVLLATACGSSETKASWLERFLVQNHIAPVGVKCGKGNDGYDYVCTYRASGKLWKQGFLVSGHRVTSWTSATLVADHLQVGPRPEPERRARLVRLLNEICARTPRRFSRDQQTEVVRLEPLVPAAMLVYFIAFAGAFGHVVDERQVYRDEVAYGAPDVQDAARRVKVAREELRQSARRLGVDCG
ncbi:MAG TPA: hypothetical protein VE596_18045 [Gaiellaceae bacterium]|jgi:hypothetical protein|nr:hypothetical protein [Gaiellaceae bacterium]